MLYNWIISVPSLQPRGNPVEQTLGLATGIVTWYSIVFPPGCAGLVHCKIFHHAHQIVPSKADQDLSGDTFPIEWNDYYELYESPAFFQARCWSEDDMYPHNITIRIAVLPRRAVAPTGIADTIKNAFGMLSPKRIFTARS